MKECDGQYTIDAGCSTLAVGIYEFVGNYGYADYMVNSLKEFIYSNRIATKEYTYFGGGNIVPNLISGSGDMPRSLMDTVRPDNTYWVTMEVGNGRMYDVEITDPVQQQKFHDYMKKWVSKDNKCASYTIWIDEEGFACGVNPNTIEWRRGPKAIYHNNPARATDYPIKYGYAFFK